MKFRSTTAAGARTVRILKGNVPGVTMANVTELQYFEKKNDSCRSFSFLCCCIFHIVTSLMLV